VRALVEGRHAFDEAQQTRLLEISRSVFEIGELASAVAAPRCNADGSPMITTQAATGGLDANVVLQMMQTEESAPDGAIAKTIASSFDDDTVAGLLATALARDGRASARRAQIVSIADVFDALRSNRPYREGLATTRIKSIMNEQGNPAFNQVLLRRFVNLMGLFPIGTSVRLSTEEVGVVTAEHPEDPFRPQVKILYNPKGEQLEAPYLANTWERDSRGDFPRAVVESVDPDAMELDPLTVL
jgi:hypothetical protein